MQSVGGIQVGEAQQTAPGFWSVPIFCDVSGLKTVTQKPTTMNSGLVVTKVLQQVQDFELRISVVTNTALSGNASSTCPTVTLAQARPGTYTVVYLERDRATHKIGVVTLGQAQQGVQGPTSPPSAEPRP
jgi:hypothetical protein